MNYDSDFEVFRAQSLESKNVMFSEKVLHNKILEKNTQVGGE